MGVPELQLPARPRSRCALRSKGRPGALISRNLEPDADYFHFAKSLFQFYIRTGI